VIVFVCGPSGIGKTSTIEKARLAELGVVTLRASTILDQLGQPIRDLTTSQSRENQEALFRWLALRSTRGDDLLLDGHLVISTTAGLQPVSESEIAKVPFDAFIMVCDDLDPAFSRAKAKAEQISRAEFERLVGMEERHAEHVAALLGARFEKIASFDAEHLRHIIVEILGR